jgi:hypothetical protein
MRSSLIGSKGHAALNAKEDAIIIDDVSQGPALYKLSTVERVKTFEVPAAEWRSRNVAFHDSSKAIISSSDHGQVYVFNRCTGDINDILQVGVKDWVQSIAVSLETVLEPWNLADSEIRLLR